MQERDKWQILLVDDYPNNLFVMEVILEPLDAQIRTAHCGEEALEYVHQQEFDLIIMDVKLPGIDGFETARGVRERWRELPIIFLTGYVDLSNCADLCPGPVDFLAKPFDPLQLREKTVTMLRQFQPRRELDSNRGLQSNAQL